MPLYQGELLSTRLARRPALGPGGGAQYRHQARARRRRRCIAPASSIATSSRTTSSSKREGSLKLIDLGVVRVPGLEDFPPDDIPGTLAYMAPEMFAGEPGNEADRHLCARRHHVPRFRRRISLRQSRCHQPAAPRSGRSRSPNCGPIFRLGCRPRSARAIAARSGRALSRHAWNLRWRWRQGPARAPHQRAAARARSIERHPVAVLAGRGSRPRAGARIRCGAALWLRH